MLVRTFITLGLLLCFSLSLHAGEPRKAGSFKQDERLYGVRWRKAVVRTGIHRKVVFSSGRPAFSKANAALYVATGEGDVWALDEKTGATLWRKKLGVPFEASVTLARFEERDLLLLSAKNGTLFCLHADQGELLWQTKISAEVSAPWQTDDAVAYGVTMNDKLVAIALKDGALKWQKNRSVTKDLTIRGSAQVLLDGEHVYAGFSDGYVESYKKQSGVRVWSRFLSVDGRDFVDVDADLLLREGRLYVASYSDGIYALDAQTGRVFWRQERVAIKHVVMAQESVIALSADGYAEGFALKDGKSLFTTQFPRGAVSRPVVAGGGLLFSVSDVGFIALNAHNGEPLQQSNFGDASFGDLLLVGTTVFSFASSGYIYALDLASDSYVVL